MSKRKKHPGRKRRIGGWMLMALAVMVAGVWVVSGYRDIGPYEWRVIPEYVEWSIRWGQFTITIPPWKRRSAILFPGLPGSRAWYIDWRLWRYGSSYYGSSHNIDIEANFWPLPVLLAGAGVPVLRSGVTARRRAGAGVCAACGYDRRGLGVGVVCPECGKAVA